MKKGSKKKKQSWQNTLVSHVKRATKPSWELVIALGIVGVLLLLIGGYVVQNSADYGNNYRSAQKLLNEGDYEAAYVLFKKSNAQDGEKSMEFYVDYARAAYFVGDAKQASEYANRAKALASENTGNPELQAMLITINNIQAGTE